VAARSRAVGWILFSASVLALVLSVVTSYRSRAFAECQNVINEQLIVATTARASAAAQDRQADRDETAAITALINAVFSVQTPEQRLAAYQAYRAELDRIAKARAEAEADRAAHPLPAPPSQTCRG
jgi:hypothetical protein